MGCAVGDCLGSTVEFAPQHDIRTSVGMVTDLVGGGPFDWAPGEYTDDTQMAAAMALGADGVWCGSVWLTTDEAETHPVVKQKFLAASSADTIRSRSLTGKQYVEGELFNLHNKGEVNEWTKRIVDAGLVIGFALVPLFLASRFPARLQAWIPDRHSVLTLVTSLLVSKTAHLLEDSGWPNNGAFRNNISEFREIFVYWLAWLYLGEIVLRRRMAQGLQGSTRSEDQDAPAS